MTGEEHAIEADRLGAIVDSGQSGDTDLTTEQLLGLGQLHATLALVDAVKALAAPQVEVKYDLNDVVEPGSVQDMVRRAARTNVSFPTF